MTAFCYSLYAKMLHMFILATPPGSFRPLGGSLRSPLWLHKTQFRCGAIMDSLRYCHPIYSEVCVLAPQIRVFIANL